MLIALDRERAEPLFWTESLDFPDDLLAQTALFEVETISCTGRVEYVSPGFLLTASLTYAHAMECTRCLKPLRESVEQTLEVLLMTPRERDESAPQEDLQLDRGQLSVGTLEEEEVETSTLVFELVQLQVPMKPLCREDCAGLCPRCGSDRNETPDCCQEKGYDSRWSGLEGLKQRLQQPDS